MPDGNCLFSSVSLLINGTNDFVHNLRISTAFEMYENCKLYCDHPLFSEVYNENSGVFSSLRNIFDACLTEESSKQGENDEDKIKHEAVYCCQDKIYCGFITTLALSSVIGLKIVTWYPDVFEAKYKLIFSRCIEPIGMYLDNCSLEIHLLWCPFESNKPNHFVPLLASYKQGKGNGKQKSLQRKVKHQRENRLGSHLYTFLRRKRWLCQQFAMKIKLSCHHPQMQHSKNLILPLSMIS